MNVREMSKEWEWVMLACRFTALHLTFQREALGDNLPEL